MSRRPDDDGSRDDDERSVHPLRWIWETDRFSVVFIREVTLSVLIVLVIAALLFGMSGVWPPLVAVESDSMENQIMTGDLVFIVDADRYVHEDAIDGTGVVPKDIARENEYERFDRPGDVIIFAPNGDWGTTPIIHRAHLWVTEGEDWSQRADPDLLRNADSCDDLSHCPAPHDGFITHGDNNAYYDQIQADSAPVKSEWVIARAHLRVPLLGRLRLIFDEWLGMVVPGVGVSYLAG